MIKKISLIVFLIISFTAASQLDNSYGIKAGTNYSQFTPDTEIAGVKMLNYQGKIGYYIGGFYNFNLSQKISLQPELLFSNQGTKIVNGEISVRDAFGNFIFGSIESKLNEFSISIPIIIRFKLTENIFLEAGPQASYTLKRTEIIKKDPFGFFEEGQKSTDSPLVKDFDKFDAGLNIGIGLNITEKLDLNLRYILGLIERDNNYKTSVINLGVGFKI